MLGSCADFYKRFEKRTYVGEYMRLLHDAAVMNCVGLYHSQAQDDESDLLTYMSLSHLYILIPFSYLFRANMDDWDELGMYHVGEQSLLQGLGSSFPLCSCETSGYQINAFPSSKNRVG